MTTHDTPVPAHPIECEETVERIDHALCEANAKLIIEKADKYQGWDCIDYPVAVAYLKMRRALKQADEQRLAFREMSTINTLNGEETPRIIIRTRHDKMNATGFKKLWPDLKSCGR